MRLLGRFTLVGLLTFCSLPSCKSTGSSSRRISDDTVVSVTRTGSQGDVNLKAVESINSASSTTPKVPASLEGVYQFDCQNRNSSLNLGAGERGILIDLAQIPLNVEYAAATYLLFKGGTTALELRLEEGDCANEERKPHPELDMFSTVFTCNWETGVGCLTSAAYYTINTQDSVEMANVLKFCEFNKWALNQTYEITNADCDQKISETYANGQFRSYFRNATGNKLNQTILIGDVAVDEATKTLNFTYFQTGKKARLKPVKRGSLFKFIR